MTHPAQQQFHTCGVILAIALCGLIGLSATHADALTPPNPTTLTQKNAPTGTGQWNALSKDQQIALQPLEKVWSTLPANRQLKWLSVAANFRNLSESDQHKLQSRMHHWVVVDGQQRDAARRGFAETKQLSSADKKIKWEAYQTLSQEEKTALAKQEPKKKSAAAKSVAPVPLEKKVNMPEVAHSPTSAAKASNKSAIGNWNHKPKLAHVADSVMPNTLLPTQTHHN